MAFLPWILYWSATIIVEAIERLWLAKTHSYFPIRAGSSQERHILTVPAPEEDAAKNFRVVPVAFECYEEAVLK